MITVAFTVSCRRPRYLRRTLESWARARGAQEARFVLCLEPPARYFDLDGFREWLRMLPVRTEVVRASRHMGCTANTRSALEHGFRQSSFTVVAEEDIEVADDTLEYFTWARDSYAGDGQVLAACANSVEHGDGSDGSVLRAQWFSPLVWGTWRDRWEQVIAPAWTTDFHGWDGTLRTIVAEQDKRCVFPACSRALHFGEKSTLTPGQGNGQPNFFHRSAVSRSYRGRYGPQQYCETAVGGAVLY